MTDVLHGLRASGLMLWDTLWALVLGFGLSGAVQAFVSRDAMRRRLGDHRPAAVTRAALYGAASSSCSYAASAMARSLFARGADLVTSLVFMVASTNLVIELGIVLVVLLGWAFLGAEVVGGVIMIVLLTVAGAIWLRGRALAEARAANPDPGDADEEARQRRGLRSTAGWAEAAGYTISDLTMLRKELVIGFLAAGFLGTLVPAHVWSDVFVHGHGGWTSVENVLVGPLVALISGVCSVGNVPLAAALWKGGISFGGAISFIFGDLISFPILLVYRKQYGWRMAVRMLAVLWAVMAVAGLATEGLFHAAGWVPATRPAHVAPDTFHLGATTVLDIVALVVLAGLWWLHRHRDRFGAGAGLAQDPVCGMQVERAQAPATADHGGGRVWFCSEHCRDRFVADPERYAAGSSMARE